MSVLNLWDAYHTLHLKKKSQKICGITPYYGSPTYYYLRLGMGISASSAIWQQFVDHIIQELQFPDDYQIIMDDALIFTPINNHTEGLQDLFRVLCKFGLKISPHKCQFYRDNIIYMGLKFIIRNNKACYTSIKDKCDAILNLSPPKSVKEVRQFCSMANFLSSFFPKLRLLLVPIYELTKKKNLFMWTQECQQAFNIIKDLCTKPPILHMPNQTGKFWLESDTSREGIGGTLYQLQNNSWLLIGSKNHSKKLPDAVRNYGVAELELTGLYVNINFSRP